MITRRNLLSLPALLAPSALTMTAQTRPSILELRYFYLRNTTGNMPAKATEFLKSNDMPASQKAGAQAIGYFSSNLAPEAPFLLALRSWESIAAFEQALDKLNSAAGPQPEFVRMERHLLRSFSGMPRVAVAAPEKGRLFELRTYESDTDASLRKKVGMFNDGEIAIFRKTGLEPVFFGEMISGRRQPCLVYLLAYESLTAREANWNKFLADPDWQKLRATPGLSDGEIVSNISASFLRGLPFSPIR
jgi:hypothetical protein